jgi:hypothetical protein
MKRWRQKRFSAIPREGGLLWQLRAPSPWHRGRQGRRNWSRRVCRAAWQALSISWWQSFWTGARGRRERKHGTKGNGRGSALCRRSEAGEEGRRSSPWLHDCSVPLSLSLFLFLHTIALFFFHSIGSCKNTSLEWNLASHLIQHRIGYLPVQFSVDRSIVPIALPPKESGRGSARIDRSDRRCLRKNPEEEVRGLIVSIASERVSGRGG